MPKSCNGAGSYYIALSSSFQLPVRRQQSCTAIQLDDRLYTELDRPLGIRSVCVCVSCRVGGCKGNMPIFERGPCWRPCSVQLPELDHSSEHCLAKMLRRS